MACGTIQLHPGARRNIGIFLSFICMVQFIVGVVILSYGGYFLRNLQWKISVTASYNSRTFNFLMIVLGSVVSIAHLCGAKMFYDSGKEATRHRFESFLLLVVVILTSLFILEFAAAIACKIHIVWFDEIFANEKGFIKAIKEYGTNTHLRLGMDQLQVQDQCCGAENFSDWLNQDWVSPHFNPLLNPSLTPEEKSLYYPWRINSFYDQLQQPELNNAPPYSFQEAAPVPPNPNSDYYEGKYGYSADEQIETPTNVDISSLDGFPRRPRGIRRHRDVSGNDLQKLIDEELARQRQPSNDYNLQGNQADLELTGHLSVVPWSCCSVDYLGPCIHDYVTQQAVANLLRVKAGWNSNSLNQRGCWSLIKNEYVSFMSSYTILCWTCVIIQVVLVLPARYLQTSVENIDLYDREDKSAPGYLWGKTSIASSRKVETSTRNAGFKGNSDEESVSLLDEYERLKRKRRKRRKLKKLLMKANGNLQKNESDFDLNDERNLSEDVQQSGRKMKLKDIRNKSKNLLPDVFTSGDDFKRQLMKGKKAIKSAMLYMPDRERFRVKTKKHKKVASQSLQGQEEA